MSLADNAKFGKILVGSNGHTLYLFEKDQGTTSACLAACAANWPALTATGTPSVGAGITASKVSTASGQLPDQVVYNGHLLYFFARDAAAGDVNGVSIAGWYPVGADGNKIDKS
jgi:predicted lipoprotein with Yx(FWY)xxD motif